MPNGRSGGFLIEKVDLAALLETVPLSTTVGFAVIPGHRARGTDDGRAQLSAADAIAMVDEFKWPSVWIEEQDHRLYVVHLDRPVETGGEPEGDKWVVVEPESSVFVALRERHEQHRESSRQK